MTPLAQLVDLFPDWVWFTLYAGGLTLPAIALIVHRLLSRRPLDARRGVVIAYYVFALPLAYVVFSGTQRPLFVCTFLVLLPFGILLGLICLLTPPTRKPRFIDEPLPYCPTCGYDLRATPNRCPECGNIPRHDP